MGAIGKYVLVVDEDNDPTNVYDVGCMNLSRSAASIVVEDAWNNRLFPMTEKSAVRLVEEHTGSRAMNIAAIQLSMVLRGTIPKISESYSEIQSSTREKYSALL